MCCPRRKVKDFEQTIAVLRHSERVDQVELGYKDSPEGLLWPHDTPITAEGGVQIARASAEHLAGVHAKAGFTLILCSPYRRCLETAAEVAKLLKLPVLIDEEIGEVWEEGMPEERPPHRSAEQLKELADGLGIVVLNPLEEGCYKVYGEWPKRPETVRQCHERTLVRIETFLQHSAAMRQNFIVVTHAPAVAAMVNLFQRGMALVEHLDYCGCIVASRKVPGGGKAASNSKYEISTQDYGMFGETWAVEMRNITAGIDFNYTEDDFLKFCAKVVLLVAARRERRSKSDEAFEKLLRSPITSKKIQGVKGGAAADEKV